MKGLILRCALAALLVAALPAFASSSDLGVYGSFTKPKDADNAWGGGATSRIRWFEIKSTYFTSLTASQSKFSCPPFCANGKPRIRYGAVEAGFFYKFNNDRLQHHLLQPYLGVGAGYYELTQTNRHYGSIGSRFGWYAEGGTDINLTGRFGLMIEVNYRNFEGTLAGASLSNPIVIQKSKVQLGGPGLNAGIVWHFY
jgi:hypothetical protein